MSSGKKGERGKRSDITNNTHPNIVLTSDIQAFQLQYQELAKRYGKDVLKYLKTKEVYIPVSVFIKELSGLEIIVLFLKEQLSYKNVDIANLLNRSEKTIWQAYHDAKNKYDRSLPYDQKSLLIPVSIFCERKLSILETLVHYMKMQFNLTYAEIAVLLHRDPRTIWTVFKRGEAKCKA